MNRGLPQGLSRRAPPINRRIATRLEPWVQPHAAICVRRRFPIAVVVVVVVVIEDSQAYDADYDNDNDNELRQDLGCAVLA